MHRPPPCHVRPGDHSHILASFPLPIKPCTPMFPTTRPSLATPTSLVLARPTAPAVDLTRQPHLYQTTRAVAYYAHTLCQLAQPISHAAMHVSTTLCPVASFLARMPPTPALTNSPGKPSTSSDLLQLDSCSFPMHTAHPPAFTPRS